jgi:hypothetical protein
MLYSGHRYMTPRVRRFVDFAAACCRRDRPLVRGVPLKPVAYAQQAAHADFGSA